MMGCLFTVPGNATYSMTKAAVESFSDVIREELRPYGYGVTTLFPGLINTEAAKMSGKLRAAEEQAADASVRPYHVYVEERGEVVPDVGAGRGRVAGIGAGDVTTPIEPDVIGPVVVRAIEANRPYCMTHAAPPAIRLRADALQAAFQIG